MPNIPFTPPRSISIPSITQEEIEQGKVWSIVKGYLAVSGDNLGKVIRFTYKKILRSEICVYCGNKKAEGLDHIHPRIMGGPDGWANRAPACGKCDKSKGHRPMLVFLAYSHIPKKKKRRRQANANCSRP